MIVAWTKIMAIVMENSIEILQGDRYKNILDNTICKSKKEKISIERTMNK